MAFKENCMCISERRLEECMSYLSSIKNDDNTDFIATAMCCVTKELCRVRDLDVIIAPKYDFKDSDVKQEYIKLERETEYDIKDKNLMFFPPILPSESRRDISFRNWLGKETGSSWWKIGCSKGNI